MANIIKRVWNQNRMVQIEDLRGMTFQAEAAGHTFQISGIDDEGNTVALTGTPSGVLLRPDNTDVALTCSVSGGVVSATLPANCYDVPGRFGLTIFITSGSSKTAIYAAVGTVTRTSSGTVAPGTSQSVVDLINAINAAVNSIPASYSALLADIAPTYSDSALYGVGQYAWYDGDLKRCIVPITTAESYTAAHWTSAVLGQDVSDLKSALNEKGNILHFNTGKWINTSGIASNGGSSDYYTDFIYIQKGSKIITNIGAHTNTNMVSFYSSPDESTYLDGVANVANAKKKTVDVESDCYARFYFLSDYVSLADMYTYVLDNNEMYLIDEYIGNNEKNIIALSIGNDSLYGSKYDFRSGAYQNDGSFNTWYRWIVESYNKLYTDEEIEIKIKNGYKVGCHYWNGNTASWKTEKAGSFIIPAGTTYTIQILKDGTSSGDANINEYISAISVESPIMAKLDAVFTDTGETFGYRYLAFTFAGTVSNGIILLGSNDLRHFNLVAKRGFYTATKTHTINGGSSIQNTIRDPAIIKIDNYYYILYTIIGFDFGSNQIGLCRTKDFVHYEELNNLTITCPEEERQIDKVWAPCWFRDGDDVYILSSCGTSTNSFWTVISLFDPASNTAYAGSKVNGLVGIDYHLYHENGYYYAVGGGNQILKSTSLTGEYSAIQTNLPTGSYEAEFVETLDNGKKRLYRQKFETVEGVTYVYMVYADANSLESQWGEEHQNTFDAKAESYLTEINQKCYYHWTIYDFKNGNDNNNYFTT